MLLSGADILVKTLIEQGCDTVFGYPGGQILNVYDSLYTHQNEIHHILTAHEQGAAHAADGYARTAGKVGVVLSTSGPGATNLVTGIATAYLDSIPMVAICGNVPTTQIGTDSFQEIDITGVTLPSTLKKIGDRAFMFTNVGDIDLPAGLEILSPGECLVTLREGKFHQVKRMLAARGKPVTYLKRLSMGPLRLDPELAPGAFRMLTAEEKKALADCR